MPNTSIKTTTAAFPVAAQVADLLQGSIEKAARAYLDVFLAKVPSYTGASRGQLAPLAGDAGVHLSSLGEVSDQTGIDISNHKATFTVAFPLEYFQVNEVANANQWGLHLTNPGPYNVLPAAEAAALEVIDQAGDELAESIMGLIMARLGGTR